MGIARELTCNRPASYPIRGGGGGGGGEEECILLPVYANYIGPSVMTDAKCEGFPICDDRITKMTDVSKK